MGKKKGRIARGVGGLADPNGTHLTVDPSLVRFQHSKIRPFFSGCWRSVQQTLDDIVSGKTDFETLPPIEIIAPNTIPATPDGTYFSLNNRRLWIIKELNKRGLLDTVVVRTRACKSEKEKNRYTVENCSLNAKFIREKAPIGFLSDADLDLDIDKIGVSAVDDADRPNEMAPSTEREGTVISDNI